jgi:hypothetical protein
LRRKKRSCIYTKDNSSVFLLLKDRPEIAKVLNGHDSLKRWLVKQFSGKATKFPILWDSEEPTEGASAEHYLPQKNKPAKIRVSKKLNGLDQLSGAIFELFNVRYYKGHSRLRQKAYNGEISKKEYSNQSLKLEYKAMKKCKYFLKKHYSVFAAADGSNLVYQKIMSLGTLHDFLAMFEQCDVESSFDKFYEEKITPYLFKKEKI